MINYIYPATCGPQGHGSSGAAAEATAMVILHMFHPVRELCPFTNFNVMFAELLFALRNFCLVRELDPIDELGSEHKIKLMSLNLRLLYILL